MTAPSITDSRHPLVRPEKGWEEYKAIARAERLDDIAHWFKDHVATRTVLREWAPRGPRVEELEWGKPGSSIYRVEYLIHGSALLVYGDLAEAVYRWSSAITFPFLAECSIQYFASKCYASDVGRKFEDWDARECLADFRAGLETIEREHAEQHAFEIDDLDAEEIAELPPVEPAFTEAQRDLIADGESAIGDGRGEWMAWATDHMHDVFGTDSWEYVPRFGMHKALSCEAHLAGIKAAVKQLGLVAT